MNLLYITAVWSGSKESNMHLDFVRQAAKDKINVTVLALCEKRTGIKTSFEKCENFEILHVSCGNIQKTGKYKKVISSVFANVHMLFAAMRYLRGRSFDVCVWSLSTTLIYPGVNLLKHMFGAKEYLLLKEYWPQDPVDLGAMREGGFVYNVLKFVEKRMMAAADYIGASSQAGIKYVTDRYPENADKCEVCPHCEEPLEVDNSQKDEILASYGIPTDKTVFIYGGNFGLSQGIDDMISCIQKASQLEDVCFVLLGSGTEYQKVFDSFNDNPNVILLNSMAHSEFIRLASCCSAGMIFLFKDYNVPNIPGKFNTYLNAGIPVVACVDKTTDLGDIITEAGCGIKVSSGDTDAFCNAVKAVCNEETRREMSVRAKNLLLDNFTPEKCVRIVMKHFE